MTIYINPITNRIKTTPTEDFTIERENNNLTQFELENFYQYEIRDNIEKMTAFIHMNKWDNIKEKANMQSTIDMLGTMLVNERLKGVE